LSYRSWALWFLGFPETARADAHLALRDAREIGHAGTLLYALFHTSFPHTFCGDYATAKAIADEVIALADEKGASFWKAQGMNPLGCVLAMMGECANAVYTISSGIDAYRSTGSTGLIPWYLTNLAQAHLGLGQFDAAWSCIGEAITLVKTSKERWCEAEINRVAGEVAAHEFKQNIAKAKSYFERALAVAREQQAKSWELRAAMSFARLWRDQGKVQQARELLAPVYGWFTEGFDTRDLKEAKALLEELAA